MALFSTRAATGVRDENHRGEGFGGSGKVKTGTEDASRLFERTRSILDVSAAAI